MKQYRLRLQDSHNRTKWTDWRNIDYFSFKDEDILSVQFNEPLTVTEAKEFFKHYMEDM